MGLVLTLVPNLETFDVDMEPAYTFQIPLQTFFSGSCNVPVAPFDLTRLHVMQSVRSLKLRLHHLEEAMLTLLALKTLELGGPYFFPYVTIDCTVNITRLIANYDPLYFGAQND